MCYPRIREVPLPLPRLSPAHLVAIGLSLAMLGGGLALFVPGARNAGGMLFILACAGIFLLRRRRPELFESRERVEIDEQGVRRFIGPRQTEAISWSELVRVSITTTDAGPAVEDFYFLLHRVDGGGVAVANEHAVAQRLLERLQRLPGFDSEAVVEASGSTSDASFLCWEGAAGGAEVAARAPEAEHQS